MTRAALDLRTALQREPPAAHAILIGTAETETAEHLAAEKQNLESWIVALQRDANELIQVSRRLGNAAPASPVDLPALRVSDALASLAAAILARCCVVDEEEWLLTAAYGRLVRKTPPARKGGQIKDCVIVEHSLEIARRIRGSGSTLQCVFCSPNTKDYCDKDRKLHPALQQEFDAVKLEYLRNLNEVRGALPIWP